MVPRLRFGPLIVVALAACSHPGTTSPGLAGQWEPVTAELGGQVFPVANFGGAILRLTADAYEFGGDKGTYAMVSSTRPARLDIQGVEGPNAGRTIQAIYQLAGEELTVCYQLGPGDRPGDFTSPKGSQVLLVHYRRVRVSRATLGAGGAGTSVRAS
jgi:uncharacterized protein (TIGR03067 family)